MTWIIAATHMKLFTLFLAFVMNGEIKVEQKSYNSIDECREAGEARVEELQADPRLDGILAGMCIQVPGQKS